MRIDVYLTSNGYVDSRSKAQTLILDGDVTVDGKVIKKPSHDIDEHIEHIIEISKKDDYVGRGGLKLECAIENFKIDVKNLKIIDVGASTGGFTNCLLSYGAGHVTAVDCGKGQLHKSLIDNPRVKSVEGYNARELDVLDFGMFDGAVMDVSFISQTLIIPALSKLIVENGFFISLIKPQFEAGRGALGKNGIVKNPKDRELAIKKVVECAEQNSFVLQSVINSPIQGGDGNYEYLAWFVKGNKTVGRCPTPCKPLKRLDLNFK